MALSRGCLGGPQSFTQSGLATVWFSVSTWPMADNVSPYPSRIEEVNETTEGPTVSYRDSKGACCEVKSHGKQLVTPAFVNGHTHLALSFLRGALPEENLGNVVEDFFFRHETALQPGDVRAFTRMGAFESLGSGVGFVWDHYYHGLEVAEGLRDVGLAGVVAPTLQDLAGPGKDRYREELEATLAISGDSALLRIGIGAALGPHASDTVSDELFREIGQLAEQEALPVHMHLAQSLEELQRAHARWGKGPLEALADLGLLERAPACLFAHGLFLTGAELDHLSSSSHRVAYCPLSQLQFAFPAPAHEWAPRHVRWVLGTDCSPTNDGMDVQRELAMALGHATLGTSSSEAFVKWFEGGELAWAEESERARRERQSNASLRTKKETCATFTPPATLSHVWQEGSRLHPKLVSGALEPGALANLAIWDLNHSAFWPSCNPYRALTYGSPLGALQDLIVAGESMAQRYGAKEEGLQQAIHRSEDYREARREADERLRLLRSRTGFGEVGDLHSG